MSDGPIQSPEEPTQPPTESTPAVPDASQRPVTEPGGKILNTGEWRPGGPRTSKLGELLGLPPLEKGAPIEKFPDNVTKEDVAAFFEDLAARLQGGEPTSTEAETTQPGDKAGGLPQRYDVASGALDYHEAVGGTPSPGSETTAEAAPGTPPADTEPTPGNSGSTT